MCKAGVWGVRLRLCQEITPSRPNLEDPSIFPLLPFLELGKGAAGLTLSQTTTLSQRDHRMQAQYERSEHSSQAIIHLGERKLA